MDNNTRKFHLDLNRKQLAMLAGGALVLLVLLGLLLRPGNIVSELTVEAGLSSITANDFRREDKGIDAEFVTAPDPANLSIPGKYPVSISYKGKTHGSTLIVEDTVAPVGKVCNVSVYAGHTLTPEAFVTDIADATAVTVSLSPEPDLTREAQNLITVTLTDSAGNKTSYEAVLSVFIDNGMPQITGVAPIFTFIGTEPEYLAGVTVTDDRDLAPDILVDSSGVNLDAVGTYDIRYTATDAAGNTTTVPSTVTVTDDNTAPVIQGVHSISLYIGATPSYDRGVIVTDDKDAAPRLEIDSSQVDLSSAGTYPLVYIARDMTGNETRTEVTVTVTEKPATFVDEERINDKADELLQKIVTDDMTAEAKVKAIYAYIRSHYTFQDRADQTDWMQGAWVMMDSGEGNFFNYYALTKLMLERCDIPNIDVRKVPNFEGDTDHRWSLVSVDGGNTYYHLDTTPRTGSGDDFCLVTDAELDAYSNANKGCHNRDKSLYPATPAA